MKKLAIVTTHPIQYNAPWFQLLAERGKVELKVFYTWSQAAEKVKDKTFGREIKWDIPLLKNYNYEFIENVSKQPGSHRFFGIDCPALIPRIKAFTPDAILFFGWNFKSHLRAMRYFHGKIPVWFRGDSTLLNETPGMKSMLRRVILTGVYRYVNKVFYVGKANKDYFLKHGLKNSQLIKAPHAIDNNRFADDNTKQYKTKAKKWREELGYKPEDILIIYAGKLMEVKQIQLLIDAFKIAVSHNKNIQLLIVGNGPLESDLKVSASNISKINFLPFQNQTKMPLLYRMGNVFCLPSKSETWGLAINEAMASSTPVIVSNKVGCANDLIVNGENGFIFKYDEVDELVTILQNLKLGQLEEMGTRAAARIQDYNFKGIVEALEDQLETFNVHK